MFNNKTIAALSVFAALTVSATSTAMAGGFTAKKHKGGYSAAKAYATSYANIKSRNTHLKVDNHASVDFKSLFGGKILKANAESGNNIYLKVNGKRCYKKCGPKTYLNATSSSRTKIYAKGKSILAKSQAINYVELHSKGKLLLDYESDSYAIGNFTPLGVHVDAGTFQRLNLAAKGYVRLKNGNLARSSVTIK